MQYTVVFGIEQQDVQLRSIQVTSLFVNKATRGAEIIDELITATRAEGLGKALAWVQTYISSHKA